MRVSMARFPFQKTLDAFDFKFQPSIDPKVIRELATGRYLETGDNVLLLGPPGVGKTHLAVALGLKDLRREHGSPAANQGSHPENFFRLNPNIAPATLAPA